MTPTIGRIVQYTLSEWDVKAIDAEVPALVPHPPAPGGQRQRRNSVHVGQVLPALVTAVFGETCVNLRVFLDGDCSYWATSRTVCADPTAEPGAGKWHWPARV